MIIKTPYAIVLVHTLIVVSTTSIHIVHSLQWFVLESDLGTQVLEGVAEVPLGEKGTEEGLRYTIGEPLVEHLMLEHTEQPVDTYIQ